MSTDMSLWFAKLKSRSKLEPFYLPHANKLEVQLFVKRDDLIDPFISGNKLRKLEGNFKAAKNAGAQQLPTLGGANPEGILGCTEIYTEAVAQNNNLHFDAVFIAQATTTTSLGLLASIPATTQLFVVPVLKGFDAISEMQALAQKAKQNPTTAHLEFPFSQVRVLDTHHHGGYAKTTPELMDFIQTFNDSQQFPIEPTYTAKSCKNPSFATFNNS